MKIRTFTLFIFFWIIVFGNQCLSEKPNIVDNKSSPAMKKNLNFMKTVKVGGYIFPPFVVEKENDQYIGITIDLLNEMNSFQKKYKFQFVITSSKRRYLSFDKGEFDIIMFEDIIWGWKDKNMEASKVILKGGEVYITKADPSKDQSYFNDLKEKSIACFLGYHYGFANFNADEKFLRKNFNIQLSSTHKGNIKKVLTERADIAVVTLLYLKKFFENNPDKISQILVSEKFDQRYNHTILLRKNAKIDAIEMNALLSGMEKAGFLARVWEKRGEF